MKDGVKRQMAPNRIELQSQNIFGFEGLFGPFLLHKGTFSVWASISLAVF